MYNVIIGIDISKNSFDAAILKAGSKHPMHDAFLNRTIGFKQLIKWVNEHVDKHDQLLFCMEHTGYYARQLCLFLDQQQCTYVLINALNIKHSMGPRREKSDKADAKIIAAYGLKFQEQLHLDQPLSQTILDLQLLLSHRKGLQRKALAFQRKANHLKHCLSGDIAKQIIRSTNKQMRMLNKELERFELHIDEFIHQHNSIQRNFDLLTSIPGIGRITALYTISYTHNFTRIKCPRKFACYAGVAPFKNESGTSVYRKPAVSHFANKKLKEVLHFGAMNAIQNEPTLKAYYKRKVEQGKAKMSVLNAVRNKLIHRMFAVIKRQSPYVVQPLF